MQKSTLQIIDWVWSSIQTNPLGVLGLQEAPHELTETLNIDLNDQLTTDLNGQLTIDLNDQLTIDLNDQLTIDLNDQLSINLNDQLSNWSEWPTVH